MWIRNVLSHSAARAPHLFPTPGRGGVFPPSSTPGGVCAEAPPSPARAWSLTTLPSGTAGDNMHSPSTSARSMRLCARTHRLLAHLAAALRNRCASIGQRVPDGCNEWGPACPRPGPPFVACHRGPFAGPVSSAPEGGGVRS